MSLAYRGLEYAAERRFQELSEILDQSLAPLAYERRVGRVVGGIVGTIGGVLVFTAAIVTLGDVTYGLGMLTAGLLGSGVAAAAAYLVARLFARVHIARVLGRGVTRSEDPVLDVATLETHAPARVLSRLVSDLEYPSVLFPMLAISILAPLTLHVLVAGLLGTYGSFDSWIRGSVMLVGHAHLVLCICCARYAGLIRSSNSAALSARGERDWTRALGFTTLAAAIPGVLLMAVPPILTFVTGIVFIPAMYKTLRNHVVSERAAALLLQ